MSTKSDRDNRSNQLNPNNDTYYSSRGADRNSDDDGDDWPARNQVGHHTVGSTLRAAFNSKPTAPADLWRIEKRFFFDFVDLEGRSRHFHFVGRAFQSPLDAEDVAEKWMRELKLGLYAREVPLAMYRVIDPLSGQEYPWMSDRYRTGLNVRPWYTDPVGAEAVSAKLDAAWERSGKNAVNRVMALWNKLPRVDLGACTFEEMRAQNGGRRRLEAILSELTNS